jgi:tetratricopeptide (TPR) repeat protein
MVNKFFKRVEKESPGWFAIEFGMWLERYRSHFDEQWVTDSIENAKKSLDQTRANQGPSHPLVGAWHFTLGRHYHDLGRYDEAIIEYRKALRILTADPKTCKDFEYLLPRGQTIEQNIIAARDGKPTVAGTPYVVPLSI